MKYGFTVDAQIKLHAMDMKFTGQSSSYVLHLTTNREESAISYSRMNSVENIGNSQL